MTLEKRKLVPNWTFVDDEGQKHALWDFRQKSHVVLIIDPRASEEVRAQWRKLIQAEEKQWSWLHATVFIVKEAPKEVSAGVYLLDRYGLFMTSFSIDQWTVEAIEREYVYHEARHC